MKENSNFATPIERDALMFIKGSMHMHFKIHDTFSKEDYEQFKKTIMDNFGIDMNVKSIPLTED